LIRGFPVTARTSDAISSEADGIIELGTPVQLVLFQAREASVHDPVVERCPEYGGCPIATCITRRAPGTAFSLRDALLVDIVVGRGRIAFPEVVSVLVWIGQIARFARAQGKRECH
jgi:hypothetical protein